MVLPHAFFGQKITLVPRGDIMGIVVKAKNPSFKKEAFEPFGINRAITFDEIEVVGPVIRPKPLPVIGEGLFAAGGQDALQKFCHRDFEFNPVMDDRA